MDIYRSGGAPCEIGTAPNRYWEIGTIKAVPISLAGSTYFVGATTYFVALTVRILEWASCIWRSYAGYIPPSRNVANAWWRFITCRLQQLEARWVSNCLIFVDIIGSSHTIQPTQLSWKDLDKLEFVTLKIIIAAFGKQKHILETINFDVSSPVNGEITRDFK